VEVESVSPRHRSANPKKLTPSLSGSGVGFYRGPPFLVARQYAPMRLHFPISAPCARNIPTSEYLSRLGSRMSPCTRNRGTNRRTQRLGLRTACIEAFLVGTALWSEAKMRKKSTATGRFMNEYPRHIFVTTLQPQCLHSESKRRRPASGMHRCLGIVLACSFPQTDERLSSKII